MSMLARIELEPQSAEQRQAARRPLRLELESGNAAAAASATVRNLSETGLLLEAPIGFEVGETVTIGLPIAGAVEAKVIWARAPFFGCSFARPISRAAVSATLLRAPFEEAAVALLGPVDTTWRLDDAPAREFRRPSAVSIAALSFLASAVVLLVGMLTTAQLV